MKKVRTAIDNIRNIYTKKKRERRIGGFSIIDIYNGHFSVTYRGIPTLKCPFDYVLYQMILTEVRPDLLLEIGTSSGGTALYLADLMDIIGHGVVHTIDNDSRASLLVSSHPRIKLFKHGWEGYHLDNAKGFQNILVIDDASHMREDVIKTMKKFSPLVSLGSYFIIEDGIVSRIERDVTLDGGPLQAIHEFLKTNRDFQIDKTYCNFFGANATFNPDGYLKRIR
jgi:cephalosporin hydroxylase